MILKFSYFENIWNDMHSKLCLQDKNHHFLTYLAKKILWKSHVFTIFYDLHKMIIS